MLEPEEAHSIPHTTAHSDSQAYIKHNRHVAGRMGFQCNYLMSLRPCACKPRHTPTGGLGPTGQGSYEHLHLRSGCLVLLQKHC